MRFIEEMSVFCVPLIFSLFAYLWILVVLQYWTPEIVPLEPLRPPGTENAGAVDFFAMELLACT